MKKVLTFLGVFVGILFLSSCSTLSGIKSPFPEEEQAVVSNQIKLVNTPNGLSVVNMPYGGYRIPKNLANYSVYTSSKKAECLLDTFYTTVKQNKKTVYLRKNIVVVTPPKDLHRNYNYIGYFLNGKLVNIMRVSRKDGYIYTLKPKIAKKVEAKANALPRENERFASFCAYIFHRLKVKVKPSYYYDLSLPKKYIEFIHTYTHTTQPVELGYFHATKNLHFYRWYIYSSMFIGTESVSSLTPAFLKFYNECAANSTHDLPQKCFLYAQIHLYDKVDLINEYGQGVIVNYPFTTIHCTQYSRVVGVNTSIGLRYPTVFCEKFEYKHPTREQYRFLFKKTAKIISEKFPETKDKLCYYLAAVTINHELRYNPELFLQQIKDAPKPIRFVN